MSIDNDHEPAADARVAEAPRGATSLAKCLKAGMPLIRSDDRVPVQRALRLYGTLVDVACVKEIVAAPSHASQEACESGGSCSASCRMDNVFIRYEDNGISTGCFVAVRHEELVAELIALLTYEIEHGFDTVIDPEAMLRVLALEVGMQGEAVGSMSSGFVSFDESAPVERVIEWRGIAVDVRCVTRVEIISAAEMAEEFRTTGCGLPRCTDDVAVVRYSNGEVTGGLYVEVLTPELNAQLVERLTHEIQHGTDPRIDLHSIAWELEMAFQSHPSRRRSKNHPANLNFFRSNREAPMSDAETKTIPVVTNEEAPENPYLRLTLRERAAIDESALTDTQMGQLLFADDKRVQEFKAVVSTVTSEMKATVRETTAKAARGAKLTATRLFNGIKNTVAEPANVDPELNPGTALCISHDEAVHLITALSYALADAGEGECIDLGGILDHVAGNDEHAAG